MDVGPYCLFTFYVLFSYSFCVTFISTLDICSTHGVVVFILHMLCFVAHTRATYINPGINDSNDGDIDEFTDGNILKCSKCHTYKPLRTHHCRICKRCVYKMDHHCPWINNCVGLYNQKFFFLFTFYLTLLSGYLSSYIIYKFIYESSSESDHSFLSYLINYHIDIFFLLIVVITSTVFGLVMFIKQLCSIHNNITTIEYKKEDVYQNGRSNTLNNYVEVFGSKPFHHWLSPFSVPNIDINKTLCSKFIRNNDTPS